VTGAVCARYAFRRVLDFGIIVSAHGLALICRFVGAAPDPHQKHVYIDLQLEDRV